MKHLLHLQTKALIAVLLMVILAPLAHAASTFTVDYLSSTGKFTVTRSNTTGSETVLYRTVSLSALAGVHFAPVSGSLTFNDGIETLEVPVTEYSNVPAIYRYQNSNSRSYMLEVLDINGYYLAKKVRYIGYGSASNVTKAKFNEVKSYTISSSEFTVTDKGYKQGYHAIPVTNFFTSNVPYEYLAATRCKLEMLVEFDAREVDDGYQYIQILINNETTCDEGAGDGDPGGTDKSIYKAGFTHEGGKKNTTYEHYAFPSVHDYNYYNDNDDNAGRPNYAWRDDYGNTVGRLIKQFFKARGTNDYYYYRNNDGWLELPLSDSDNSNYTLNTVGVRFDASGNNDDDWMVKNLVAKVKVDDNAGWSVFLLASEGLVVSPGPYKKGNTFYISIPADRIIVHNDDYPKLTTSWGTAIYDSGSGSNVMTFKGTITADAGTVLSISSYSGTIKSLSDQHIAEGIAGTTFNNCVVTEDYTLDSNTVITNLFDEPFIDNGVNKPLPISVTWRNKTLTEGTDYTVSYDDNRGPESGTKDASIIITGMGIYSGSVTGTYTIRAVELSDFYEIETGVYEIANKDDLMHLAGYVSDGRHDCMNLTFRQTADITDVGLFCPIGGPSVNATSFKGTYDGQGFTISGIHSIDGVNAIYERYPHWIGLFGRIGNPGVVKNIVLENSVFNGKEYVGAIVAYNDRGLVKNCRVGDDVIINPTINATCHGGIVGYSYVANIEGCVSAAVINSQNKVGGIIGSAQSGNLLNNLYTGTTVISGTEAGAILGNKDTYNSYNPVYPTFTNVYYLDSNQPGAVNGSNNLGGVGLARTITLGENVSIQGEVVEYDVSGLTALGSTALMSDSVIYSCQGDTITLGTGDITIDTAAGYEITYYVNGTAIEGNTFVMPDANVTVTATITRHRYVFNEATGELRLIWGEFNSSHAVGSDVARRNVLSITASDEVSFTGDCTSLFWVYENCVSMDFSQVNTDSLTRTRAMFDRCKKLETIDVTGWNTANVTDMQKTFIECYHLTTINGISDWNTGNVTNMESMFEYCSNLDSLDFTGWNTSNVENMSKMFFYNNATTALDLSSWNTSKVKDMTAMFQGCPNLTSVTFGDGWSTDSVTSMQHLFYGCLKLDSLDLSGWNTANVTNMSSMFFDCRALKTLIGTSDWNTGNVTDMSSMFENCNRLTSLDLSEWNTGNVTNMSSMFRSCSFLTTIFAGDGWNTDNVTSSAEMFYRCTRIKGGKGTAYNSEHVDKEYARIDKGESAPGYFTEHVTHKLGDLNSDGSVDVSDVNICINIILGSNNDPVATALADLNGDGTVDISDVNALINIILTN
ncbi:MAG: BspA family leucine-rich repeat surface protein [Muribaculaceae bacterium]|nr:BspA family leucine-rich repeat surface protein [Muribaculaceae bacterium]